MTNSLAQKVRLIKLASNVRFSVEGDQAFRCGLDSAAALVTAELGPAAEVLTWRPSTSQKPDSDITVLCFDGEHFFCGYWADDSGWWIDCSSGGRVDACTHWAEPHGPV